LGGKFWFCIRNTRNFTSIDGVVKITADNFSSYINQVEESIYSFNSNYYWEYMWDLDTALRRLQSGQILFLGRDSKGALAHVWADKDYLYNVYAAPRRESTYSVDFVRTCINQLNYDKIYVYVDTWNKKSQKFTEKIGFKKTFRMDYSKLYTEYLEKLIYNFNNGTCSIMYPPDYQGYRLESIPNSISTVVFTTGTTGEPKPVLHSFDSIKNAIESNTRLLDITEDDVLINFLPTWTIGTYIYTVPTYLKKGKIFHDKFTPEGFKEYLKYKPTTTLLIPTMIDMMIDSGLSFDLSSFRNIGTGAEQVEKRHIEYLFRLGAKSVTHMYGSSEAIPLSLYNTFSSIDEVELGLKKVPTFKYKNSDSLLISGTSVAESYYEGDKIEWYDSRDHFIFKDNLFYWQNRTDNIVKKKGWKAVVEREYTLIEKEFPATFDSSTLVWHTDEGDREVTILETGGGWKFEAKDRAPLELKEGDVVYVSKTTLHKIHKGKGNLKVLIKQFK